MDALSLLGVAAWISVWLTGLVLFGFGLNRFYAGGRLAGLGLMLAGAALCVGTVVWWTL